MNAADTILRAWVNAYQRYKKIGQDGSLAALAAKAGLDAARNAAFAWADAQKALQPRTAEPGQHTHADARLEAAQRTMDARFQSAAEPAPAPADEPPPLPPPALEDHPYERWGQNMSGDFYTADQMRARDAYWIAKLQAERSKP
jgi:hypothetical protein